MSKDPNGKDMIDSSQQGEPRDRGRDHHGRERRHAPEAVAADSPRGLLPVPEFDESRLRLQFETPPELTARADRRNTRSKLLAGLRGLKHAIRGDSSFFAHGYRGTLVAISAALLGVNQWGWCLLVIAAIQVLLAELAHSAVDTLARAIGDPEEPRLRMAREIAAACVLVAAFGAGAVTTIVLSWKLGQLLGWIP
jgi:diacylglycerol kinase (ATP)